MSNDSTLSAACQAALKERDRLRAEANTARAQVPGAVRRHEAAKEQVKQLFHYRREVLRDAARRGAEVDEAELDRQREEAEREVTNAFDSLRGIRRGYESAEAEVVELHYREFGSFAEWAESLARVSAARFEALESAYSQAFSAWHRAASEWELVRHDYNSYRYRASEAPKLQQPVPPCPLPAPGNVFGTEPPRLPEVRRAEDEKASTRSDIAA